MSQNFFQRLVIRHIYQQKCDHNRRTLHGQSTERHHAQELKKKRILRLKEYQNEQD